MELLPWVLLLLGGLLLGGIYWVGKRREKRRPGSLLRDAEMDDLGTTVRQDLDPLSDDLDQLNRMISQHFEPAPVDEAVRVDSVDDESPPPGAGAEPVAAEKPGDSAPTPAPEARAEPAARTQSPRLSRDGAGKASGAADPETIVALHVAAPRRHSFHGPGLVALFEERGYEFGELNIFHSLYQGVPVFSVVNMVKPGWFDLDDIDNFECPGISLFMQLPGPHSPTVAFDVLLSEARALAEALGGTLQDAGHSTLTQQTVQHLREQMVELQNRGARVSRP